MIDIPLEIAEQTPVAGDRSEAARPVERLTDAQKDEIQKRHDEWNERPNADWTQELLEKSGDEAHRDRAVLLSEMKAMGEELETAQWRNKGYVAELDKVWDALGMESADVEYHEAAAAMRARAEAAESQLSTLTEELAKSQAQHDETFTAPDGRIFSTLCAFNHWTLSRDLADKSMQCASAENKVSTLTEELPLLKRTYNRLFEACAGEQDRAAKAEATVSTLTAQMEKVTGAAAQVTEDAPWWCPRCKIAVQCDRVTYQENHDDCGTPVYVTSLPEAGKEIG